MSYVEFELIGFSENSASDLWRVGPLDIFESGDYYLFIGLKNTETDERSNINFPFSCVW